MNSIECRGLGKTYRDGKIKVTVFDNLDFAVARKEMVAIIGVSGAGKTTLLQLLGGLDKPSSGEVWIEGQCINKLGEKARGKLRNRHLGFIYQFHHLLPEFNALENVCMPLLIRGLTRAQAIDQAKDMITHVGLEKRFLHRVSELSGGERQRIAIARALVTQPSCVLADEPTGNLDQSSAQHIYELMLDLNQKFATSFVVVTHNESLAARMQRIYLLNDGKLCERR